MKKEEALALWRASPGTVLASWEVNAKGARDYGVKSVDEWIGDMRKESTNLVFHECIHPTSPCRIYGDVDIKRGEPGFDQPEAVLDAILEKVERAIRDTLRVAVPPPILLDATTTDKFSVHFLYDVWMENPYHVYGLLQPFLPMEGLDEQPYPQNIRAVSDSAVRWLRCPYSHKYQKRNPLVPRGAAIGASLGASAPPTTTKFDAEQFCRALIGRYDNLPSAHYAALFPVPQTVHSLPLPMLSMRAGDTRASSEGEARARKIAAWLKQSYDAFEVTSMHVEPDGSWEFVATPPLYCCTKRGKHASNCMYIGSRDSIRVYYRCPDIHCRETIYFDHDFRAIAYGECVDASILNMHV